MPRSLVQLTTHPLRTALTLLGVVFGVASVVAMVSIGEGAQREILAGIEAMGARNVHLQAKDVAAADLSEVVDDSLGLSRADVAAIEESVPGVEALGFRAAHALKVSSLPGPAPELRVLGVSERLPALHKLAVGAGRPLVPADHRGASRVAVLGAKLAAEAFPPGGEAAVGREIRLDYAWFEVVGVLRGREAAGRGDLPVDPGVYDRAVLLPFDTLVTTLAPPRLYGELELVTLQVATLADTLPVKAAVAAVLAPLHGQVDDFRIVAPEELLRQRKAAQSVLNTVLICIAAISLVVGGIGVMNIMLANIMERVPEIGLRRAVGATRADIRRQFLTEALVICCLGGIAGIGLGLAIAFVAARIAALPVAFAWESTVLSFGISLAVGLVFGLMPAMRAAEIHPIEALRNDG